MPQASNADPGKSVLPIPAAKIGAVWPRLSLGFSVVKEKAGLDSLHLIRTRLESGQAFLFAVPGGFFILMPLQEREPSVLIWVAYATGGDAIKRYVPIIEDLAREIGAYQIEIESPRRGYRRVFRDWERLGNRYIRRLA